jgi:hypothetical protein
VLLDQRQALISVALASASCRTRATGAGRRPAAAGLQPVAELLQGPPGQLLERGGQAGQAGVDVAAAVLDEPVGVEQHGVPGVQGGLVGGARAGQAGAQQPLRPGGQQPDAAVALQDRRRQVPGRLPRLRDELQQRHGMSNETPRPPD